MRKKRIVIENGKHGRKILVYGFCNNIKKNTLESACCVDCYSGQHGKDAIEKLELQPGDEVIAAQDNNRILVCFENGGMISVPESIEIIKTGTS